MASHTHSLSVNRFVDQMSLALKNYQSEVDRLREELSILCDQAGKKTKEEVDKVQNYNDIKIRKLNDTIELLQNVSHVLSYSLCIPLSASHLFVLGILFSSPKVYKVIFAYTLTAFLMIVVIVGE